MLLKLRTGREVRGESSLLGFMVIERIIYKKEL